MTELRRLFGRKRSGLGYSVQHLAGTAEFRVEFGGGRRQSVRYKIHDGVVELISTACTRATTEEYWDDYELGRQLLEWNRRPGTAGFRVTRQERIEAWSAHRLETLQRRELEFYVVAVARAADRAELVLTGKDRH